MLVFLSSCYAPKNIAYFQDREPGTSKEVDDIIAEPFKVRPGDRLSIYVKSRNEQLSQQFNMYSNGGGGMMVGGQNGYGGYIVDDEDKRSLHDDEDKQSLYDNEDKQSLHDDFIFEHGKLGRYGNILNVNVVNTI